MRRLAAFLFPSVLAYSLLTGQTSPQPPQKVLALTHVIVIDMKGGPFFQINQFLGPRMVIASAIIDGPTPYWPGSVSVRTPAEAREAVDREKQQGADFIKVYSLLPREPYFAIAAEAKKLGIPFAGHVPEAVSAEEVSDAGQRTFEHLTGILAACSRQEKELLEAAQGDLADILETQAGAYDFREAELNSLGYQLLQAKKVKEAIRIFLLNAETYPQSGNVYDSLAEAYMINGDKELAIANYRKSLQLDPANKNAVEMLKKLAAP